MSIAITGAGGQLAGDLIDRLGNQAIALKRPDLDLSDTSNIANALDAIRPTTVINCAAYNLVDQAESEPDVAYQINALGPRELARWCSANEAHLIHVSTDYVFTGASRETPWTESDAPEPASAYGVSKLAGEYFVRADSDKHTVVRTCGLYGTHGNNFVKTMLRLAESRDELNVVADQHCTPTATSDLADWIIELASNRAAGLWHATNDGQTTWAEFARAIFNAANKSVTVHPITSREFGAAATRPTYSVLDNSKLDAALKGPRRNWQDAVAAFVQSQCD